MCVFLYYIIQTSDEMEPSRLSDISTLKKLVSWPKEDIPFFFLNRNALPAKV